MDTVRAEACVRSLAPLEDEEPPDRKYSGATDESLLSSDLRNALQCFADQQFAGNSGNSGSPLSRH